MMTPDHCHTEVPLSMSKQTSFGRLPPARRATRQAHRCTGAGQLKPHNVPSADT
jgi:hypothetical protein